ncbi:hypothetical protein, variant [Verruconis gallopava]|uniref:Cwf19-like C-terminal domain-containing protein n=1 Tax=Verruconis gallopava TaxID=253628 RepID=A0A0D2AJ06_9PEZI|nr:uncharacterized protein PV09_09356 [Verruconis gallopava]XP_016208783.1 hypothetical protein, variant [Verruconis gallopava]KIV98912.1 hypothetical protein PV09_09356 [Verruconis gallopava]KIV98913.1 hypothetical protein, variant [Verruconis gallopava]
MGLEEFERQLAAEQANAAAHGSSSSNRKRDRSRSRERKHRHSDSKHRSSRHRHRHHDHFSSSSRRDRDDHDSSRRKHKRSRRDYEEDPESDEDAASRKRKNYIKRTSSDEEEEGSEDVWAEKESYAPPPNDDDLDDMLASATSKDLKRDDWMQAPSAIEVEYRQRKKEAPPRKVAASEAEFRLKMHKNELNHFLKDSQDDEDAESNLSSKKGREEVDYEFGDTGSQWRMTKLKAVYDTAKESGRAVEEVALERYGSLREFDEAREEEIELERRKLYGEGYVGKVKPSGELFEERKLSKSTPSQRNTSVSAEAGGSFPQGTEPKETSATKVLDATALNKLRAQVMKAKMKKDPSAAALEAEYEAAMAASANRPEPDVVVLSAMENRMLAGGRAGEVKPIDNKRGRERGLVEENEDMSIEDMIRQERRTKTQNGGLVLAERIAKDAKFDNDLDYMDDNASKLAKAVAKSEINLRNIAIADFQKMNRILDTCPLCHHEDRDEPPVAPIVSLATRVYMTLPTEPEIAKYGATIVPIQHHVNLLECDDDEWEELRNFMKSLTRMYHALGLGVIFYENAAAPHRKRHATLEAVPLPVGMAEHAPAYFREAILQADEEWSQHKKLIDTLKKSQDGLGKLAFRRSLVKDVPYFHVWFTIDGGLGHVVEDEKRWPKGDLFAREVLGGMLDVDPSTIKKQGRWHRQDRRIDGFRKKWSQFDWTKVLLEENTVR